MKLTVTINVGTRVEAFSILRVLLAHFYADFDHKVFSTCLADLNEHDTMTLDYKEPLDAGMTYTIE